MKNVKYGKCVRCGRTYEAKPDLTNCECGGILDIVYDYDYIKTVLTKEKLARRENRSMWRYRELLPVEETTPDTPLRVGWSPLYEEPNLARLLGLRKLWIKDDGQNPTASLKDRASAMAVAKAYEAGARTIACSSTGNAASSLAGNAAAAGFKTYIFVPERAPKGKVAQLMIFGANVISVKGNYEETFKMSAQAIEKYGWYNRNAAINPYLSEGKKTVALEIAEQLNWEGLQGPVRHRLHPQAAPADLRPVLRLLSHQPCHSGEQALGAYGGEHHRRLHLRGRAPERRQGPGCHPRVQRPGRLRHRRGDPGRSASAGPHLRRVRRARRRHRRRRPEKGL